MAILPATTRWRRGGDTSAGGTRCIGRSAACPPLRTSSFQSPRHQERFESLDSRRQLVLLNGPGRIHVFRTNLGAFSHESACPNALVLGEDVHALVCALVTRVHV